MSGAGGHRVPTIVRWPGKIAAGQDRQQLLSSLDWFPTFSKALKFPTKRGHREQSLLSNVFSFFCYCTGKLAGFNMPTNREFDGYDISNVLLNNAPSPRQHFFYHSTKVRGDIREPGALMAVRKGQYKLHFFTQGLI